MILWIILYLFVRSVLALFISGAVDGISMVIRQTILQLKHRMKWRKGVSSVNNFVGSFFLSAFESGLAAS
jgi:hypothetical protein